MASRPPRRTGDDRTLQLAAPAVSSLALETYLRYQERLASSLGRGVDLAVDPQALTEAHAEALAHSGLESRQLEEIRSAVRRFATNRLVARKVQSRLQEEGQDASLASRLSEELARLEADLGHRDRPETIELLVRNEERLLRLHEQLGWFG